MRENTGRLYTQTALRNGGRRAGAGVLYDRYDEESGYCGYYDEPILRVRFPNDGKKPEELNGPVITVKGRKE